MDDLILLSNSTEEALHHYELLLQTADQYGIQFKPSKCTVFAKNIDILGHRITQEGRYPSDKRVKVILNLSHPRNTTEVKKCLGLCGFFREYIRNMSARTFNLRNLLKKEIPFFWTEIHEKEFLDMKNAITSTECMLLYPNWSSEFELHVDASKKGIGVMLAQKHDGKLRPVRFASRCFTKSKSIWSTLITFRCKIWVRNF